MRVVGEQYAAQSSLDKNASPDSDPPGGLCSYDCQGEGNESDNGNALYEVTSTAPAQCMRVRSQIGPQSTRNGRPYQLGLWERIRHQ